MKYTSDEWHTFLMKLIYLLSLIFFVYFSSYGFIVQFFDAEHPSIIPCILVSVACIFYCMWNKDQEKGALEWVIKGISYTIALPALMGGCWFAGENY